MAVRAAMLQQAALTMAAASDGSNDARAHARALNIDARSTAMRAAMLQQAVFTMAAARMAAVALRPMLVRSIVTHA